MVNYCLQIVHKNNDEIADDVSVSIRHQLGELGYRDNLLEIRSRHPFALPADTLVSGLYIGSLEGRHDAECQRQLDEMHSASIPVVPVVKDGERFDAVTPGSLHPINAIPWKAPNPGMSVARVMLRLLGLTEQHRRVFVSYRRSDALMMGEQVWEALSKCGFEVFIDRFYIDPGVRFQDRLTEALSDKAFVVLIESPDVPSSPWVEFEINYAMKHQLGFLALTLPDTVASGRKVACVDDGYRVVLDSKEVTSTKDGALLSDAFLAKLPELVEDSHAKAMLRRRRLLMHSLQVELNRFGIRYKLISDWSLIAETSALGRKGDQVLTLTPRPPEVPDLFVLHGRCKGHPAPIERGVLVHAPATIPEQRRELFAWVLENRDLIVADEDQIVQLVEGIASGGISGP